MQKINQKTIVMESLNKFLDQGLVDKQEIYTLVVQELGIPRPTVRRIARELRLELIEKIKVLEPEVKPLVLVN